MICCTFNLSPDKNFLPLSANNNSGATLTLRAALQEARPHRAVQP
jgi:hypothetical protein